jgi:hypothetical protein
MELVNRMEPQVMPRYRAGGGVLSHMPPQVRPGTRMIAPLSHRTRHPWARSKKLFNEINVLGIGFLFRGRTGKKALFHRHFLHVFSHRYLPFSPRRGAKPCTMTHP